MNIVENGTVVGYFESDGETFSWEYNGDNSDLRSALAGLKDYRVHRFPEGVTADDLPPGTLDGTILAEASANEKFARILPFPHSFSEIEFEPA